MDSIHLDPAIRDWVLIPITLVMILQGILVQYAAKMIKDDKVVQPIFLQKTQLLQRSKRLRAHNKYLTPAAFKMRKAFFVSKAFKEPPKGEEQKQEVAPPADPSQAMVGMVKQNILMMGPQMLLMGWVNYFFTGFVLVRLPFPLSDRFQAMLQRGIMLKSLDPSYVSSLSWYFINLFGKRSVMTLILGSGYSSQELPPMMNPAMGMGGMGPQMGGGPPGMAAPDPAQQFPAEKTELEIVQHEFVISDAEYRLLGRTPPPRR